MSDGSQVPEQRDRIGPPAGAVISKKDRDAILNLCAERYGEPVGANWFLDALDVPAGRRPSWESATSIIWWNQMLAKLEFGIIVDPHRKLIAKMRDEFPGDPTVGRLADTYLSGESRHEAIPLGGRNFVADAILKDTLVAHGLTEKVAEATKLMASDPERAAELFASIAAQLDLSSFHLHADGFRSRQASTLQAAGRSNDAAVVRIALGWRLLQRCDQWGTMSEAADLAKIESQLDEPIRRSAIALAKAVEFGRERDTTLDAVAMAFDDLHSGDQGEFEAALLLAERAVAWRRLDIVRARAGRLRRLAEDAPDSGNTAEAVVRLLMCLADASGEWPKLARKAKREYAKPIRAWVLARHARYLALSEQPDHAVERWEEAASLAAKKKLNSDAADWLYAARTVLALYGRSFGSNGDPNEYHRVAQAARVRGDRSVLRRPFPMRERVLDRMVSGKWHDAFEALHQLLWHSTVIGDWNGELTAHENFGRLFEEAGDPLLASEHYLKSNSRKELKKIRSRFKEAAIVLPTILLDGAPWEAEEAYNLVARLADRITDDNGKEWLALALTELKDPLLPKTSVLARDRYLAAFRATANLAGLADETQTHQILDHTKVLIPREPGAYRRTDEDQVDLLLTLARRSGETGDEAFEQLCAGLVLNAQLGHRFLSHGGPLLRSRVRDVERHLSDQARAGNVQAALALVVADADTTPAADLAWTMYHKAVHSGGVAGGTELDPQGVALLVTTLGEAETEAFAAAMLTLARDPQQSATDRETALQAVMTIARSLPDEARTSAFHTVAALAAGRYDPSTSDWNPHGKDDLLARIRIKLGDSSLIAPAALWAAAALATSDADYETVQQLADTLLAGVDDSSADTIGKALAQIPFEQFHIGPGPGTGHPSAGIRAIAAIKWARSDHRDPAVGARFAKDKNGSVRLSLAQALRNNPHPEVEAILSNDVRRTVRTAAHRSS
ncbi:effector-associated domain EAD1-containing protein [Frankia sp. CcI49]|uniref:effector-associated domain EAD1-containing protein n=1 Tax=Frankia sp. CcI49 TaxID=1745382 RepID=UPI001056347A|nr:effector-associated domain EAD1-containing protein [Frankia sp. CcI49]